VSDPICAAIAYQFDCPDDAPSHKKVNKAKIKESNSIFLFGRIARFVNDH
jgi:hypothetical protein